VLTHRVHLNDAPQIVPSSRWTYNATGTSINLVPAGWIANDIYEFTYTAKDPTVNGLGFAAVRDFNSFLRYASADDFGNANPLAGDVTRIYTEVLSQPGRMLNDFRHTRNCADPGSFNKLAGTIAVSCESLATRVSRSISRARADHTAKLHMPFPGELGNLNP
jgi:hypothetical protein